MSTRERAVLADESSKQALIRVYLRLQEIASEVNTEDERQVCAESQGGDKPAPLPYYESVAFSLA